jgi:hypothetical protein
MRKPMSGLFFTSLPVTSRGCKQGYGLLHLLSLFLFLFASGRFNPTHSLPGIAYYVRVAFGTPSSFERIR